MLNILISVILMIVSVVGFFLTAQVNRIEQVFSNFDTKLVGSCIAFEPSDQKYFFEKNEVYKKVTYYFKENLENFDYKLKLSFREDDLNTVISQTPNIFQLDIYATLLFNSKYNKNVRFTISGREVNKDWWSTF